MPLLKCHLLHRHCNLQLSEHGQKVSDAYNYYSAASDQANTLYSREYNKWADEVNQAMQYAQILNSDYWSQTNFDEGVRQYEKSFAEEQRQFDTSFAENQRQFNANLAEQQRQHNEQMSYNWASLNKKSSGGSGGGSGDGLLSLYANEAEANKAMLTASKSAPVSEFKASILTKNEFNRRGKKATSGKNTVQYDNYQQYVEAKLDEWYNNGKGKISRDQYIYLANLEW